MKERIETKSDLIEALDEAQQQLDAFLNTLTPEQLNNSQDGAGWTVKDHLAHLIAWQNGMTALLQFQPRWPAMGLTAEFVQQHEGAFDEMNHAIYEQHKDKPAETILALRQESDTAFRQTIDALSDEQLRRPYSHYQPDEPGEDNGEPIMNWVAGNSALHIAEHLAWMNAIVARL
jgi:hypothetical protein